MAVDEKTGGIHDSKSVTRVCRKMAQGQESTSKAAKGTARLEGSRVEKTPPGYRSLLKPFPYDVTG
jgi:hypothetical protein